MMMNRVPLLIEIGTEELPAIPFLKELPNIEQKWIEVLNRYTLMADFEFFYTPRRLVFWHKEFATTQGDTEVEHFGAPLDIAYKDGNPTPATLGFASKLGVGVGDLSKSIKNNKEVLYYKQHLKGKPSHDVLSDMVNEFLQSLKFGKEMRWASNTFTFIRPIKSIIINLGSEFIQSDIYGTRSSNATYIHRNISYDAVAIINQKHYFETLHNSGVVLFQDERKSNILAQFEVLQDAHNITIDIDEDLLSEVIAITEHPRALLGTFDAKFLELPKEVIITSMKEHQRYFGVFDSMGNLTNHFVVISNALSEDGTKIIQGNQKVLRARLSDAMFFYRNDLARGLVNDGLEDIVFATGLGSMIDKVHREKSIAEFLYTLYGTGEFSKETLLQAVEFSKADLMSAMVYEFTELQGIMGYYYAQHAGMGQNVANAMIEQYLPKGDESALPASMLGSICALSLKLDNLLGLFSTNVIPTGSKDPFALRRAANGVIRIVWENNLEFDLRFVLKKLSQEYKEFDLSKLEEFFLDRLASLFETNPSIIHAVLQTGERDLLKIKLKIEALHQIAQKADFKEYVEVFKRVKNITKDFDDTDTCILDGLFEVEAEARLYAKYHELSTLESNDYAMLLSRYLEIKPYLDEFFNQVMVNVEDEDIKNNRKKLLAKISKLFLQVADIVFVTT